MVVEPYFLTIFAPLERAVENIVNKIRRIFYRSSVYHIYFRRSGFYSFLGKNSIKLGGTIVVLLLGLLIFQYYVGDVGEFFVDLFSSMSRFQVLLLFYISETILGLIPPDFFIIWGQTDPHPYQLISILALISYFGGFTAYLIGRYISSLEKVNDFLINRFRSNFEFLNKWGGFFVVVAAMFPLPFAIVSTITGVVRFPVGRFLFFGLTRILRFFIYGLALQQILG
jgi:membrane protein YqaA with SNARE-associated domain